MTVQELIDLLETVENKELPIKIYDCNECTYIGKYITLDVMEDQLDLNADF